MSDYKLKNVCDFDLAQTLECGQCFHFVKLDEEDYVYGCKGACTACVTGGRYRYIL
ncbi:MAG: hypothetical protein ACLR7D_01710 [Lachnospira eligens]